MSRICSSRPGLRRTCQFAASWPEFEAKVRYSFVCSQGNNDHGHSPAASAALSSLLLLLAHPGDVLGMCSSVVLAMQHPGESDRGGELSPGQSRIRMGRGTKQCGGLYHSGFCDGHKRQPRWHHSLQDQHQREGLHNHDLSDWLLQRDGRS